MTRDMLFALAVTSMTLAGCDKKPEATNDAATPSVSVVVGSASAPPTGGVCPPGSTGKGTPAEPCTGKAQTLAAKWTGNNKGKSVISITNKLPHKVEFANVSLFYYDAAGKQLDVPNKDAPKYPYKCAFESGGLFIIGPNETKEVELGFKADQFPKATKTIEVEFSKVGWKPAGATDWVYWEDRSLGGCVDRPMGGKK